ncbi:MAG: hypothetical protein AB2693_11655, partial [Candidatus Thiodiazotropha sp.]
EASSPLKPPELQAEKRGREGSSSSVTESGHVMVEENMMDVQQSNSLGTSPDLHVFSKPMHPNDILQIASELRSMMLPEIAALIKDQSPDVGKIVLEAVKEATSSLTSQIEGIKLENKQLTESCSRMEEKIVKLQLDNDSLEQYGRRNILRISGIPEQPNEQTDDLVLKLAEELNVTMSTYDIDRSHRVGKIDDDRRTTRPRRPKRHRDIIVKFTSYNARYRLFQKRKELRQTDNEQLKTIYMNEDLTKYRSGILFEARSLKRAGKLKAAYSSDGKLFIRDLTDNRIQISALKDLVRYGFQHTSRDSGDLVGPLPSTSGARAMEV